jgi:hypothetical protein
VGDSKAGEHRACQAEPWAIDTAQALNQQEPEKRDGQKAGDPFPKASHTGKRNQGQRPGDPQGQQKKEGLERHPRQ